MYRGKVTVGPGVGVNKGGGGNLVTVVPDDIICVSICQLYDKNSVLKKRQRNKNIYELERRGQNHL